MQQSQSEELDQDELDYSISSASDEIAPRLATQNKMPTPEAMEFYEQKDGRATFWSQPKFSQSSFLKQHQAEPKSADRYVLHQTRFRDGFLAASEVLDFLVATRCVHNSTENAARSEIATNLEEMEDRINKRIDMIQVLLLEELGWRIDQLGASSNTALANIDNHNSAQQLMRTFWSTTTKVVGVAFVLSQLYLSEKHNEAAMWPWQCVVLYWLVEIVLYLCTPSTEKLCPSN